MDKDIKSLLEKYFEGESSLREEKILRDYFSHNEVEESLRPYQPLFRFFQSERKGQVGKVFAERLFALPEKENKHKANIRKLIPLLRRIAAVLLLSGGIWWIYQSNWQEKTGTHTAIDWSKYEAKSPEEAFKITQTALLKISSELNQGASRAAIEVNKIQKIGKIFK